MGYPTSLRNPTTPKFSISTSRPSLPFSLRISTTAPHASIFSISALANSHGHRRTSKNGKLGSEYFASISSSSGKQTASVGVNPQPVSPPPSQIGSPLFWVGVGVGLSAIFSWVATRVKNYAMQQAFKSLTEQMNTQNNQFNPAFSARPPFPFSPPPASHPSTSPSPAASQPAITVDIPATKVEAAPTTEVGKEKETDFLEEREIKEETKKYAFVDISPEETSLNTPFSSVEDDNDTSSSKDDQFAKKVFQNGAAFKEGPGAAEGSQSTRKTVGSCSLRLISCGNRVSHANLISCSLSLSPPDFMYLPEEMRNPTTFKWMLQNPQYRQQLEDMLNNMGGSGKWDSQMMDSLKDFDLNSAEVKQQFDQIGLTPEEVISKIMANPDVAMAFQNPRVQQAIMECSQNPLNITKYQNDKECLLLCGVLDSCFPAGYGCLQQNIRALPWDDWLTLILSFLEDHGFPGQTKWWVFHKGNGGNFLLEFLQVEPSFATNDIHSNIDLGSVGVYHALICGSSAADVSGFLWLSGGCKSANEVNYSKMAEASIKVKAKRLRHHMPSSGHKTYMISASLTKREAGKALFGDHILDKISS
ncbi:hypothetical protein POTOM_015449 [Populus tomentosa]|uniref:Protein TIC 40, chloroplastic n=1 Tax=Populus tomentosa TaxID=118781 RepID=A0A8X8A2Z1_POPTO|nr:hypothetical protein POTOM_015449 [Populus tomentosa]